MATSVELVHQRANLWERAKQINDAAEAEERGLTAEEQANWEKVNKEINVLTERIGRAEVLERTPSRDQSGPVQPSQSNDPAERAEVRKQAFNAWMRYGYAGVPEQQRAALDGLRADALTPEMRAIGVAPNTGAGYLVDGDMQRSIEVALVAFGGMRQAATVFTTSNGAELAIPTLDDTSNVGEIVGEHQAVGTQDIAVGQRILRAYYYSSKKILVSRELLQDSAFDIAGMLSGVLGERIGRITNRHFTYGNGANQPTGINNMSTLGTTTAAINAVTADELMNHFYQVDAAYRGAASWMWASSTELAVRKLVDGNGQYLWGPGLVGVSPNSLLGRPIVVNDDMPAMATTAIFAQFGDLRKYRIRDVVGFQLVRADELYVENRQVMFVGFSRHDGALIDAGSHPVKHMANA